MLRTTSSTPYALKVCCAILRRVQQPRAAPSLHSPPAGQVTTPPPARTRTTWRLIDGDLSITHRISLPRRLYCGTNVSFATVPMPLAIYAMQLLCCIIILRCNSAYKEIILFLPFFSSITYRIETLLLACFKMIGCLFVAGHQ